MSNLTPEEQREQLLKRLLPALVIIIVYFTFISHRISESTEKIQKSYDKLVKKGISEDIIPTLEKKRRQINEAITMLEDEARKKDQQLSEHTKGLINSGDCDTAIVLISDLLSRHNLRIIDDSRDNEAAEQAVPRTVSELNQWLKTAGREQAVHGWRVRFVGDFLDTYRAMNEIAHSDIEALPLSLTMQEPQDDVNNDDGKMEWLLMMSI